MVQTVLGGAQGAADVGDIVDGVLDHVQRSSSPLLVTDIQLIDLQSGSVAIIDGNIQLIVAGRGIANLQC